MPPAPNQPQIVALIVAAGRGVRAGGGLPKQYRSIGGKAILARTARLFLDHPRVSAVAVVIHPDDASLYEQAMQTEAGLLSPVMGGITRQASVLNGLAALAKLEPEAILIHDAVRPFASSALIARVIDALETHDAVLAASPVTDTLKRADAEGFVGDTVRRDGLFAAETPQGFRFASILDAHRRAAAAGVEATDDAALAEWADIPVKLVTGARTNIKLTSPEDIEMADARLTAEALLLHGETRVGTGYDVHPFTDGDGVWLGGIKIPYHQTLAGHSDADVALHALTDALLGALADGDIGSHFPPSDPQWRGASSDRFLAHAVERVRQRGGTVVHLDLAIVAEAPKIGPHRDAMRARIAEIAVVSIDRVGVKATTNEKLGFVGRGEGIAAIATATIRLPFEAPR
ncbi:bifunctional 2-C-methyl-D-erythritol 4-phosphate cytidylyltransferase/2-C-methyl-D-erythritol 2,4-cyclodiphosphate synthase [Mesorhizobium sp. BR1-1-16]|uniref:bifunctional 2-C-methyl-D-erythritol 4-phosphate cytidylyltransferase/2-C-methyl-D-erythritol 2,4-cyclodiphosphate synthase n=1 Tax=Mesorhizobium sp. BR1-1-16 TaxID=2876653 RepID=UPI001CCC5450|nr:bifunctional 2-C-methyl-D-erythritol 4-phosphate cytidylyltransferase/2-C-methyl-D-erythritol 2,4-cyclodiphosphate synthase [Mesorhizobium sp. BR1-1-16]MBZ9937863.1 bifunctional 2-C-methyl-D-erythritol 4-phosphate cytidylyltransferase/2-C-methyl-D-erythritol 2,4-cyclodiphosphate synthase [Mesorhizobium sp. BR1-1-16]